MQKTSPFSNQEKQFWDRFCKTYWEKKPILIKQATSPLLELDSKYLFTLLVRYSDYCRKTRTAPGFKLYLEGESQYLDQVLQFLPEQNDESLLGYHSRMSQWFPDYCLVCDELITVNWEQWDLLGSFLQTLYQKVGIPNRYAEMGLYLGNYRKTPFGVHIDGCGVLSVPVIGKKTFRLWKSEFVRKNPELVETHEYHAFKKQSQVMEVKTGEMSYWPSSYWHIAESDRSFTATWSIGLWVDLPHLDVIVETMKPVISSCLGTEAASRTLKFETKPAKDGYIERLPKSISRSISKFSTISEREWNDVFLKFWLQKLTRNGFKSGPKHKPTSNLTKGDLIQGNAVNPILWTKLSSGSLGLAVNGTFLELPQSLETIALIQILNSAKPILISELLSSLSLTGRASASIFKILQRLHELGYTQVIK